MDARCASCPHFTGPRPAPAGVAADLAPQVYRDGKCRRFPHVETVVADHVCGEHPALLAVRPDVVAMGNFADAVEALMKSVSVPVTAPPSKKR